MSCVVSLLEVFEYLVESILASLLVESLLGHVVSLGIKLVVHLLAQVFVVNLVVIFALHILAKLL